MRKGNSGVSAGRKRRDGALRIVMLGHKRIPSREGGIEIVVDELASRMAEKGFAVTCINRGGHHVSGRQFDEARRKEYRGIRLITVPTIDKRGLAARAHAHFSGFRSLRGRNVSRRSTGWTGREPNGADLPAGSSGPARKPRQGSRTP